MASWTPRRCHLQAPGAWLDGHKGGDALQQPVSKSWRQESLHPCSRALWPHHPLGTRTNASPCEILADTISVICEVSFCRNSSVPTSARDR